MAALSGLGAEAPPTVALRAALELGELLTVMWPFSPAAARA